MPSLKGLLVRKKVTDQDKDTKDQMDRRNKFFIFFVQI